MAKSFGMMSQQSSREDEMMDDKTETELYYAIDKDNPSALRALLDGGLDPNVNFDGYDPLGKTLFWSPLHFCCEKGRIDCAKLLLAAGANPDAGDRWCMTPLMYAVRTEWHNMVELMLSAGATVDLQDTRGRTPLHLAMECSDDVCVQLLCKSKADVNVRDLIGRTPLWIAVTQDGRLMHVHRLLQGKCDVNVPDKRDKRTPIQEAIVFAESDRFEYVRLLLAAGCDIHHRDEGNHNSMLNLMYKIKRKGKGVTTEDLTIARMLIDAGYKLNDIPYRASFHKFGGTAIKMAAEQGSTELVELFLSHGADPDLPDDCGVTPLLAAVYNDRLSSALCLLKFNCQLHHVGELKINFVVRPVNSIQCAIAKGHFQIARLLLECGASYESETQYLFGKDSNVPGPLLDNCKFWLWLIDYVTHPKSLFDQTVFKIRLLLGQRLTKDIDCLPLPSVIKRMLSLEHVFSNYEV